MGAASASTQFSVFALLFEVCDVPINWSVSTAYVASVIVHFFGNKLFTFGGSAKLYASEILRYLSLVMLNYLITVVVVWLIVDVLKSNPYMATMISIAITAGIGFALSKFWVFNRKRDV